MSTQGDARIAALARRYALPEAAKPALRELLKLLASDPAAATALRSEDRVLDDHLADALVALELEQVRAAQAIADLGSGAGVPGLVLAIALPNASVALVESNARKCTFIARAALACGLSNARVVNSRAETWEEGIGACDLVTARALGPLPVVLEYAAPLLRIGGALVVWRGARHAQAEAEAVLAAAKLGLSPVLPLPVRPYQGAHHRHLYLTSKVSDTPARFPRRPGVAGKYPLGSRA